MSGTLIFDGRCGMCTRSRNLLVWLDRHGRIETVPMQRPGTASRVGMSPDQLASQVWWLTSDRTAFGGAEAVNAALSAAWGTGLPLRVYRLPGMRQLQDAVYRLVAVNRHRLPGTTPWCETHPGDC